MKIDIEEILKNVEIEKTKRAAEMPSDQDAINVMFSAYQRLKELGWKSIIYCPKDGTVFHAIEAGSSGLHDAHYSGEWPKGHWWVHDGGYLWPGRPVLFKLKND